MLSVFLGFMRWDLAIMQVFFLGFIVVVVVLTAIIFSSRELSQRMQATSSTPSMIVRSSAKS